MLEEKKDASKLNDTFTINIISQNILLYILSYLDPRDFKSMILVSKYFHTLTENDIFWELLTQRMFGNKIKKTIDTTYKIEFQRLHENQKIAFEYSASKNLTSKILTWISPIDEMQEIINHLLQCDIVQANLAIQYFMKEKKDFIKKLDPLTILSLLKNAIKNNATLLLKNLFENDSFIYNLNNNFSDQCHEYMFRDPEELKVKLVSTICEISDNQIFSSFLLNAPVFILRRIGKTINIARYNELSIDTIFHLLKHADAHDRDFDTTHVTAMIISGLNSQNLRIKDAIFAFICERSQKCLPILTEIVKQDKFSITDIMDYSNGMSYLHYLAKNTDTTLLIDFFTMLSNKTPAININLVDKNNNNLLHYLLERPVNSGIINITSFLILNGVNPCISSNIHGSILTMLQSMKISRYVDEIPYIILLIDLVETFIAKENDDKKQVEVSLANQEPTGTQDEITILKSANQQLLQEMHEIKIELKNIKQFMQRQNELLLMHLPTQPKNKSNLSQDDSKISYEKRKTNRLF